MPPIHAFLLTRQYRDSPSGIELTFWLSSDQGPIKVSINKQTAIMFIHQSDMEKAGKILANISNIEFRKLSLKTFKNIPVAAIYFKSQYAFYNARDRLAQASIPCFETDIRPTERFLTERFITADVSILASDDNSRYFNNPQLKPCNYQPDLKLLSIDIETDYQTNALFSISLYNTQHSTTLMMAQENSKDCKNNIEYFAHSGDLLRRFLHWVHKIDPDILIGWNLVNFDFRFLQKKFEEHKIPFTIGRDNAVAIWRKAHTETEHYFLLIPGRIVLDGIDTLKSATYHFDSFSLESVSQRLLNRGKLIKNNNTQDPLHKAREIQQLFKNNKTQLAAYNLEDCKLVWDIFEQAELIHFAIERARLTGLEMDRVGGSVAAFDNLYLPRLHRKGYIAPNIGDHTGDTSAPGGYVMDSKPGLHNSVLVLDYKSLYPSIILTFHIDPYARIMAKSQTSENTIPGFNGARFSKTDYILPDIIRELWSARDRAKQEKNMALSQAIKIIMNSFYGVLGTPGCRIHDSRLTSSITLRGHEIMQTTARLIEEQGYDVIYGDTDSIFVSLNSQKTSQQADIIGNRLIRHINQYWEQHIQSNYGVPSFLEMEYETHYKRFFMPTIRGSEKGSKKRYAGLKTTANKTHIVFKGLESVRSDWTLLAREFQQKLYEKIFNDEPYQDYIQQTVTALQQGEYDNKLVYRKRLRQKLKNYNKNIPPHARAAIKAEHYFKEHHQPSRYQTPGWIEYVMTLSGPETLECQTSRLDYQHYIDKQLTPIADTILSVMNSSMEKICQKQFNLFN